MSRIFEALRKAESDRNGDRAAPPTATPAWRAAGGGIALPGDAIDRLPVVHCGPPSRGRRATPPDKAGEESFRVLRHRLELIRRQRPLGKLLVTSAVPKEGKTTVATNLAATLARASSRVLLIDADLRHPGVDGALGLQPTTGLGDWLEERAQLAAVLRRVEPHGFVYLAAGEVRRNPADVLRLPAFAEFLTTSATTFDWVVIDSPPLVPFVDAHHLATLADGVLVVLRQDVTPRPAIAQAFAALDRAFVAGAVLNGVDNMSRGYYDYYSEERVTRRSRTPAALDGRAAAVEVSAND
ncbi:MAG: CpsD/CapB family tyrosine-protein kinase [Acidobacteriota bacterium]|nr:CpsD/CapB family tyrosine-protein kinase [Acidobacteriota bacterium]